jgi:hypothetical protein
MHVDHGSYLFVKLLIFEGLSEEANIFPFLVREEFGKKLLDGDFNDFV